MGEDPLRSEFVEIPLSQVEGARGELLAEIRELRKEQSSELKLQRKVAKLKGQLQAFTGVSGSRCLRHKRTSHSRERFNYLPSAG